MLHLALPLRVLLFLPSLVLLAACAHDAQEDVLAYRRIAGGDTATVFVNVRDYAVTATTATGAMELPPYAWRIE